LCNLEVLNLFANQITSVPDELTSLKNLKHVDLAINFIEYIPPALKKMGIELSIDDFNEKPATKEKRGKKKKIDRKNPKGSKKKKI